MYFKELFKLSELSLLKKAFALMSGTNIRNRCNFKAKSVGPA